MSYKIAKRSISLSEAQAKKKEPKISLYLTDSFYKKVNQDRLYVFSVTISNQADSDNSITACELKIIYKRSDDTLGNLILNHDKSLITNLEINDLSPIDIPCHIKAHGASVGIVIFRLDKELLKGLSPEKYEVIFRDTHGFKNDIDVFLVRDVING